MSTGQHAKHTSWRRHGLVAGLAVLAIGLAISAPGMAEAVFSASPPAQTASVTAATISPPANFTAALVSSTSAQLTWTAPAPETGYTLSQSSGTLAGCSPTPSSSTTTCTATGLTANQTYTWTLTAKDNNWLSTPVTASTYASLGNGAATCVLGSLLCTAGTSVTTTSGANELVFVYFASLVSLGHATSLSTGSGTPFSSSSLLASQAFGTGNGVYVFAATGNGSTDPAAVGFASGLSLAPTGWVDVVQLGTGQSALSCSGCTDSGTTASGGGNVTAQLTVAHSYDSEIAFIGATGTLIIVPTISGIPANFFTIAPGGSSPYGTFGSTAQSSATFGVSALALGVAWGSIAVEIQQ